jgi:hypothetical protein
VLASSSKPDKGECLPCHKLVTRSHSHSLHTASASAPSASALFDATTVLDDSDDPIDEAGAHGSHFVYAQITDDVVISELLVAPRSKLGAH